MNNTVAVDEALADLLRLGAELRCGVETLAAAGSCGRTLARDVVAAVSAPPADVSAMDGYAVRHAEAQPGQLLRVIGESRAGTPFAGGLEQGEAVRIFTGAHMPPGADHVLLQEEARRTGDTVEATAPQPRPASVRRAGIDFSAGQVLAPRGLRVSPAALGLICAGNVATVEVFRRPRVGVFANGDELAAPGNDLRSGQIVNSNGPALSALLAAWGADVVDLGVASDDPADVQKRLEADVDLFVPVGGASVGDYDVVKDAFAASGFVPVFARIAVKPGKPTWLSRRNRQLALGLPGNPASALVCAHLFLRPLVSALAGDAAPGLVTLQAVCTTALRANGPREEYMRATLQTGEDAVLQVTPAGDQDSSLLSPFLTANALIRRPPGAPAAVAGEIVPCVRLAD